MAECFVCLQDMNTADGCVSDRKIIIDGTVYDPIRYGEETRWIGSDIEPEGRCHDCGARIGEIHHPGCDMEECPHCGEQYFICDCRTDEKEELWAEQTSYNSPDYETVDVDSVTVTTIVPYADGPEFHEYNPEPGKLPGLLNLMDDPEHAERVIDVEIER